MKKLVALLVLGAVLFVGIPAFADEPGQEGLKVDEDAARVYAGDADETPAVDRHDAGENGDQLRVEARD